MGRLLLLFRISLFFVSTFVSSHFVFRGLDRISFVSRNMESLSLIAAPPQHGLKLPVEPLAGHMLCMGMSLQTARSCLRVSLSDAATIQLHRAKLQFPPGLEVVSDGALTPGSAIFETSRGELDASVDTQLAEIDRGLTDALKRRK